IPNYFMGDGYLLLPGTTSITGFDLFPVNISATDFIGLNINIYVWQHVKLGTVNAATPAFSDLLAQYSVAVPGTFSSNFWYAFEATPAGSSPAFTLKTPLATTRS